MRTKIVESQVGLIEEKVREIFNLRSNDDEVKVEFPDPRTLRVRITRMYEFIPLSFKQLMELSELFGTTDFVVNGYKESDGCETCDYGSEYTHEFKMKIG